MHLARGSFIYLYKYTCTLTDTYKYTHIYNRKKYIYVSVYIFTENGVERVDQGGHRVGNFRVHIPAFERTLQELMLT